MKVHFAAIDRAKAEKLRAALAREGVLRDDLEVVRIGCEVLFPIEKERFIDVQDRFDEQCHLVIGEGKERMKRARSYKDMLDLPGPSMSDLPSSFDIIGDICIIKIPESLHSHQGEIANALLATNRNLRVVLKDNGVTGEYRVRDLDVLAGGPELTTVHIENNLRFKLDPTLVYYSPRLAAERMRVASLTGPERVLDMFCGVGPFALTIARHGLAEEVIGIDLNPECIRFFDMNIVLNSLDDKVMSILGDSSEVIRTLEPFDRIIMNLPHDSMEFFPDAVENMVKGTIHLYRVVEVSRVKEDIASILSRLEEMDRPCRIENFREVHQYSPTSSIFVYDITID